MRKLFLLAVFVVAAAAAAAGALRWETSNFSAPGPASSDTVVVVTSGSSVRAVADALGKTGVVSNPLLFRIGVMRRHANAALKAGEYAFPAHASMADALTMLIERKVVQHRITIAEGLTTDAAV